MPPALKYHVKADTRLQIFVLLAVHLSTILGNDQLDTQLLYFIILLCSSTCFEHYMLIIRRLNCIVAASGIVTLCMWLSGAQAEREFSQPAHRTATY